MMEIPREEVLNLSEKELTLFLAEDNLINRRLNTRLIIWSVLYLLGVLVLILSNPLFMGFDLTNNAFNYYLYLFVMGIIMCVLGVSFIFQSERKTKKQKAKLILEYFDINLNYKTKCKEVEKKQKK